ncbi:hypothetical protein CHARACLAT_020874 [Characodon lateralis]|uniref:Uncharacterized protein n=1 Tax=Characodon lateralis TaxID=208331 RepID=A0ABU7EBY7_9TELE|nr:hypothetical protein [Characodon lateralis]
MTLVYPIYVCTLNTEPFLGGQDLLDRLAPLIDCHQDQLWVQVEVPKPPGASNKPSFVTNQVASLEEPKEPLRPSSEPDMGTSVTQLHPENSSPQSCTCVGGWTGYASALVQETEDNRKLPAWYLETKSK